MAKVFIEESTLANIGNAIRTQKGTSALINPSNMAEEILSIQGGGNVPLDNVVVDNVLHLRKEGGVRIPWGCNMVTGNYTDDKGQAWLYNTVDLNTKVKTQYVGSIVLDGSEVWYHNTKTYNGKTYHDFFTTNVYDMRDYIGAGDYNKPCPIYIDGFSTWSGYNLNNSYYNEITLTAGFINAVSYHSDNDVNYINMADRDCMLMVADEFRVHLTANPKRLYFALQTPIQTTLTDAEIAELM